MKNKFIPNSFQVTNNIVDDYMLLISGNALKCYLLIIRKTRGWQKEKDSISISQFMKYTGIKRGETITKSINELLHFKLIKNVRIKGKITKLLSLNLRLQSEVGQVSSLLSCSWLTGWSFWQAGQWMTNPCFLQIAVTITELYWRPSRSICWQLPGKLT